jgi:alkylation response protein AidB-like acyl-CoA dehydrogenase
MDFDLSDDQQALRDGAAELLDGLADPAKVRAFTQGTAPFDSVLWDAMIEQGWLAIDTPEADGGLGFGTVEVCVLLEQLGAHCAPAPFLGGVLALDALRHGGAGELAARVLAGAVACIGWSRAATVQAETRGDGWVLHGRTDPVPYAPAADIAVVVASDPAGPAVFAVELADDRPAREAALDVTRPLGWLRFAATPAIRLGGPEAAVRLADRGAAYVAAEMLGGAQRVLDMAVAYAKDRVQFGRPIGSFQAIKHRCADMLVDVEGMRSSAYWAAWAIGADEDDASIAASTAKCWASDASKRVMASALQVHGGIGFTWEHDLHFFLKRAQLDQLLFGDAVFHRGRLTQLLRPRVEQGRSVV